MNIENKNVKKYIRILIFLSWISGLNSQKERVPKVEIIEGRNVRIAGWVAIGISAFTLAVTIILGSYQTWISKESLNVVINQLRPNKDQTVIHFANIVDSYFQNPGGLEWDAFYRSLFKNHDSSTDSYFEISDNIYFSKKEGWLYTKIPEEESSANINLELSRIITSKGFSVAYFPNDYNYEGDESSFMNSRRKLIIHVKLYHGENEKWNGKFNMPNLGKISDIIEKDNKMTPRKNIANSDHSQIGFYYMLNKDTLGKIKLNFKNWLEKKSIPPHDERHFKITNVAI